MPDQLPSLFDFDDEDFFPKNEVEKSKPAEEQPVAATDERAEDMPQETGQPVEEVANGSIAEQDSPDNNTIDEAVAKPGDAPKDSLPESYIKPKLELPGRATTERAGSAQSIAAFDKQIGNSYQPKTAAFTFEPRKENKAAEEPVPPEESKTEYPAGLPDEPMTTNGEDENNVDEAATIEPLPEWTLDKNYYTIGEVAQLFDVNVSHIRFWTTEFKMKTRTTRKGDRLYTPAQIGELRLIHHLVKVKKYTLKGAKEILKSGNVQLEKKLDLKEELQKLHQELSSLKDSL